MTAPLETRFEVVIPFTDLTDAAAMCRYLCKHDWPAEVREVAK